MKTALDIVRPGGQIVKVGWGPQPLNFSLDQLVQKAVTLQGSYSHNYPIWERVLGMLASGQINLDLVRNRIAPLDVLKENNEGSSQNDDERFDTDMALMTGELVKLIADLVAALGGEMSDALAPVAKAA